MHEFESKLGVSTPVLVLLGVLLAVQIGLAIFALFDLWRRDRVVGGHKVLWVVLILLGNLAGSIIYLTVGRNVPPLPAEEASPLHTDPVTHAERIRRGVEALYGPAK